MRISATGNRQDRETGFSLVELVVALAIIGLLTTAVALTIPDPRLRLVDEAETFAARAHAAQELAITESRDISLWVSATGYGFERYDGENWVQVATPPFQERQWPEASQASWPGDGERVRVIFDATGLNEALDLTLTREGETISVSVGADGVIGVNG